MRWICRFGLALLALLLAGCRTAEPAEPERTPGVYAAALAAAPDADVLCYVVFLGCGEEEGGRNLDAFCKNRFQTLTEPQRAAIPALDAGGEEWYLVIPAWSGAKSEVAMLALSQDGELKNVGEYGSFTGETPFVLHCNVSDIFPSALVTVRAGDRAVAFSPYISLKDGSVETGAGAVVLDWELQ